MIKICICDDDNEVINTIEQLIYNSNYKNQISTDYYNSGERLLSCIKSRTLKYNIFLLDIELSGINGIELAREIRKKDYTSTIIFISNYTKYVFDVFEVIAFDFISKPINSNRFNNILKRAIETINISSRKFVFHNRKIFFSIPYKNILYIEKSGRKAIFHTPAKTYQCNLSVKEIWERLDPELFTSIYVSVIVNMLHILEIKERMVILDNNEELPIGREYSSKLKNEYLFYLNNHSL